MEKQLLPISSIGCSLGLFLTHYIFMTLVKHPMVRYEMTRAVNRGIIMDDIYCTFAEAVAKARFVFATNKIKKSV